MRHFEEILAEYRAAKNTEEKSAAIARIYGNAACPPVRIKNPAPDVWTAGGAQIPLRYIEALEQNQQIASCCRHPENHELSAWYSSDADRAKGVPDIYVFHCSCGKAHRRFCVGGNPKLADGSIDYAALAKSGREEEKRPFWEVR